MECKMCGNIIDTDSDLMGELGRRADYYGLECLTEAEQALVCGYICEECINKQQEGQ